MLVRFRWWTALVASTPSRVVSSQDMTLAHLVGGFSSVAIVSSRWMAWALPSLARARRPP
jgi:hypothetical protein